MHKTAHCSGCVLFLVFIVFQGCSPSEQQNTEIRLMEELRQTVDQGTAIRSHDELAGKLAIPRERVQAITVGPSAQTQLAGGLKGVTLAYICSETSCTCSGDLDCNDMFTTVCSDPKTDGVCIETTGGQVTCSCQF